MLLRSPLMTEVLVTDPIVPGDDGAARDATRRSALFVDEPVRVHFDIADLRLFVHIAELGNLTRGAQRAALSPAAASSRLKSLESQLRSRLFYRDPRGLTLTSAGETLLRHARVILRQIEHVKSDFSVHSDGATGHIRMFANTTTITEVLPEVLARFMSERPGVTVDLQERNTREVVRGILDGSADIGIIAGPAPESALQSQCFSTDRLVLATPFVHPSSGRSEMRFEETLEFPHIGLQGSTLDLFLTQTVNQLNQTLNVRVMMSSFEAMCRMIEAGVGVGIVPESAARRLARSMRLNLVRLSDPWAFRERRVLYRDIDALPGCARIFLDMLLQAPDPAMPARDAGSAREDPP
ncbi:Transcriptional regulator LysR family [Variovorax sp. WDL1]|nr:Transcriptional regulator LysR family [Variovorax sp. WDL1]